jgi:hypothetical protein
MADLKKVDFSPEAQKQRNLDEFLIDVQRYGTPPPDAAGPPSSWELLEEIAKLRKEITEVKELMRDICASLLEDLNRVF